MLVGRVRIPDAMPAAVTPDCGGGRAVSLEEALGLIPWGRFQWLLFITCGLGYTADTIELLLLSFAFSGLREEWGLDNATVSLASTVSNVGIMAGAICWGILSDCLGRRMVFLSSVALTFGCGLLSALCPTFELFVAARFGVGFGIGGNLVVDFAMFMEFVPQRLRQRIMMMLTMWGVFGVGLIALCARTVIPWLGWRWYVGVLSLPPLVLLIFRTSVPESPGHLYAAGKLQEALDVVKYIAMKNRCELPADLRLLPPRACALDDSEDPSVPANDDSTPLAVGNRAPCTNLSADADVGADSATGCARSVAPVLVPLSRGLRRVTACLGIVWFSMSFAYGGFTLWLPELLRSKGLTATGTYDAYIIMVAAEVPGLCLATWLVQAGMQKRFLLALCGLGCGAAMVGCALATTQLAIGVALAASYFFVVSAWAALYIITPEAYPVYCRSTGSGLSRVCSCIASMVSAPVGAILLEAGVFMPLYTFGSLFLLVALVAPCLPASPPESAEAAGARG